MSKGIVQFEAEIHSLTKMRSRVTSPQSVGPWVEGGLEDLIVHFMYAGWTACNMECAMSMMLVSDEEETGQAVVEVLAGMSEAMGAVQMAEMRMTRKALDEMRRDRIEP
jgi:hypothetical protein